ncbi:hypothetical protein NC651_007563 [Populus alba x Populus x berolinensis]|nr:hypothetical protein NC651_007563 [Populus alba x Populus x berolinensis]
MQGVELHVLGLRIGHGFTCSALYRFWIESGVYVHVQIDVEDFVSSFRPDFMEAVAGAMSSGDGGAPVMPPETGGSSSRAIEAAKSSGGTELEAKLEEAVSKIKRDNVRTAARVQKRPRRSAQARAMVAMAELRVELVR